MTRVIDARDRVIAEQAREITRWKHRAEQAEALVEVQKKLPRCRHEDHPDRTHRCQSRLETTNRRTRAIDPCVRLLTPRRRLVRSGPMVGTRYW